LGRFFIRPRSDFDQIFVQFRSDLLNLFPDVIDRRKEEASVGGDQPIIYIVNLPLFDKHVWPARLVQEDAEVGDGASNESDLDADKEAEDKGDGVGDKVQLLRLPHGKLRWESHQFTPEIIPWALSRKILQAYPVEPQYILAK
jgi:hypothetical protein